MLDRLTGMQVFARIAGLGSISAAARSMQISATMATKHLASLEEQLGVQLLHRTTRRLTLTEAGRQFLESAERILAEFHEAETVASAERVEVGGLLRINVPLSFGFRVIAPLMPELRELYPALKIEMGLSDRVVDLVEEGWDVAIRVGQLRDSSMIVRKLAPCRLLLVAAPDYLRRHGTPRTVADLGEHDCLGYTLSPTIGATEWSFGADGRIRQPIDAHFRANNGDALVALAIGGAGITYQPTFLVADAVRSGQLVPIALDQDLVASLGIFALFAPHRRPPAKIRAFVDFLVNRFGKEPPWEKGLPGFPMA
ncbi:DNA-binding transcriptional regulator, LysR family [Faunimonas pinastri]|uniref:DNA-binding transcriptional regulator, LysR family n=1 Tax=Faunimonas pinastri TaxID=1855383 RepID=A0A1H9C3K7_9HYPH|nr:LysR family transcriptional regulator [Faunimonas pinastri]SEP95258.1 DNA-binding transcriptional regulator, LysR family [Faunimonas pinastri]